MKLTFIRTHKVLLFSFMLFFCLTVFFYKRSNQISKGEYLSEKVARGNLEISVLSTGSVAPWDRTIVRSMVSVRVERLLVTEGQKVRRGQVLAQLIPLEYAILLDAAQAKDPRGLEQWKELYQEIPLIAPQAGTVISKLIQAGEVIVPEQVLFIISDRLIVTVELDETDIAQIHLNQAVKIVLDSYPDLTFHGRVKFISYDAITKDNITTYKVNILPKSLPSSARSGMTANANFLITSKSRILLLPNQFLKVRANGRYFVLKRSLKNKNAFDEQEVVVGVSDMKKTEIISGLKENEMVFLAQNKKDVASGGFMDLFTKKRD